MVSKDNTIGQIIKHVFYMCNGGDLDIKLPYDSPEGIKIDYSVAYELRLVTDETPLYEIAPLEETREVGRFKINAVAFCAKKGYCPKSSKKIRI